MKISRFFAFSKNLVFSDHKNTNLVEKFEPEVLILRLKLDFETIDWRNSWHSIARSVTHAV